MINSFDNALELLLGFPPSYGIAILRNTYDWIAKQSVSSDNDRHVVIFLASYNETFAKRGFTRHEEGKLPTKIIKRTTMDQVVLDLCGWLMPYSTEGALQELGKLAAAYGLSMPEPIVRGEGMFRGLHKTADIPAQDDDLTMTEDMIEFCWHYYWNYTWLGY